MQRVSQIAFAVLAMTLPLGPPAAADPVAKAVACDDFLHQSDGSWRSFISGAVVGNRGPVIVAAGEIVRRGHGEADGIAKILDELCQPL